VRVIPNQEGDLLTPSVMALTEAGEWLVGEPARRQAVTNPTGTLHSLKRILGRDANEIPASAVGLPYQVRDTAGQPIRVIAGDAAWPPEQLCALLLRKLKQASETYLGCQVRRTVITVPTYFNDAQRQATLDAARIAGFDVEWELQDPETKKISRQRMRLLNEPTAAALAFVLNEGLSRSGRLAVLHLGGGSFDISLVDFGEGVIKVESVGGDTNLGGDDFDAQVMAYLTEQFRKTHPKLDPRAEPTTWQRLREAAEQAKKDLTQAMHAHVFLPFLACGDSGSENLELTLTREKFEELVEPLVKRLRVAIEKALQDARLKASDVNEVLLVGGMTRVPRVANLVAAIFGREGSHRVHADESVAVGAAIQGAQLLLGSRSVLLVVDVAPMSLGIAADDGKLIRLIERNCSIPLERKYLTSTARDNQTAVKIAVYQGENEVAKGPGNRLLGELILEDIRPAPHGQPRIEVTFSLDKSSILDVTAEDLGTGKSKTVRLFASSGLTAAEVERLYREAEQERLIRARFNASTASSL
jgi:molecular chaperone DnaK